MTGTGAGSPLWYLSRGSGVVILVLFTLVVLLGVITRAGRPLPGLPRFAVSGLHRNLSLVALLFLAVHVLTAVADSYVPIALVDVVVPFGSRYHPWLLGLGTLATDLAIALVLTSLIRDRIGRRIWKALHWSSYALWPMALTHGLLMGPDATAGPFLWITLGAVATFLGVVAWRALPGALEPGVRR